MFALHACLVTSLTAKADATNAQITCQAAAVAQTQPHVSLATRVLPRLLTTAVIATPQTTG